ncbi:M12 family metallo-peptidase, partial [Arthrospira platensis SPKY1]|nr:M12 family metallo-peptidase [Arthrospira platensis SPKY1]
AGEPFDVDYAAHEIGHQFGGNHTFNNSCSGNRNNPTAWEPGSGSTIMAYAGICTPNVQSFSDAYFHGGSQAEVRQFTVNGNGNTCPQLFPSGNLAPQVDAGPDRVIPHST